MRMKTLFLMTMFSLILSSCSAQTAEKKAEVRTTPLNIASPLLDNSYQLLAAQELTMPLGEHGYLIARKGAADIEIRSAADFARIVKGIATTEDALAFARLITSEEIRPYLQGVNYQEVHKQAAPTVTEENGRKITTEDRWFAVEAKQYDAWKLHEPTVKKAANGAYVIERFAASYPNISAQTMTPAKLLHIRETVTPTGAYTMEIIEKIAEGEAIERLLLFTK